MQNQNKTLLIIVVILICTLIAGVLYLGKIQNDTYTAQPVSTDTTPSTATPGTASSTISSATTTVTTYSMQDVMTHANESSCWTVIRGKVYDLTSYVKQHPGGSKAVLRMCGTDGTANFTSQHGGKKGPESSLAKFEIGVLK